MKKAVAVLGLGVLLFALAAASAHAGLWEVKSPDHRQTFAYGSERNRSWLRQGSHLAAVLDFTNDPYVDNDNPRQYDDFIFQFPNVVLGQDGRTFYYRAPGRKSVPVAVMHPGLFGEETRLLPASFLVVDKLHGRLSLTLLVSDQNSETASR
jgi:hypothetical protein